MPRGLDDWHFEVIRDARSFIRELAINTKNEDTIRMAKELCEHLSSFSDSTFDWETGKTTDILDWVREAIANRKLDKEGN